MWSWVTVALAVALIVTGAVVATRRARRQQASSGARGSTDIAGRPGAWTAAVRKACFAGDPAAARDALMGWAKAKWPEHGPLTPGAVATKLEDLALAAAVADLDRALYAPGRHPGGPSPWSGKRLWRAFKAVRGGQPSRRKLGPVLPGLYPDFSRADSDPA